MKNNKIKHSLLVVLFIFISTNTYSQKFQTNNIHQYDSLTAVLEINKLYKMLLAGDNFGDLATKYTQDPGSFKNMGILKPLSLDDLDEGFRYYIKKIKIGEVSKPFETVFGWHIAKVLEIDNENKYVIQHILIKQH